MITLWGRFSSCNVQKAVWALEELGRFGGNADPDYLAMNPNGLVPTLRDGDLVIWESHAIVRYLTAAYGMGGLFPDDARDRAVVDQWTDWTEATFQPAWIGLFWHVVRTPVSQQDRAAIAKAMAATNRCFAMMEERLGKAPYLGGELLTYADIVAGVSLYRWTTMAIDRPVLPSVEHWHARLSERVAFRKAVNVDYEELRGRLSF